MAPFYTAIWTLFNMRLTPLIGYFLGLSVIVIGNAN
jgi:hypothetical protein